MLFSIPSKIFSVTWTPGLKSLKWYKHFSWYLLSSSCNKEYAIPSSSWQKDKNKWYVFPYGRGIGDRSMTRNTCNYELQKTHLLSIHITRIEQDFWKFPRSCYFLFRLRVKKKQKQKTKCLPTTWSSWVCLLECLDVAW